MHKISVLNYSIYEKWYSKIPVNENLAFWLHNVRCKINLDERNSFTLT